MFDLYLEKGSVAVEFITGFAHNGAVHLRAECWQEFSAGLSNGHAFEYAVPMKCKISLRKANQNIGTCMFCTYIVIYRIYSIYMWRVSNNGSALSYIHSISATA